MAARGSNTARRADEGASGHIDITLRFNDDGGLVYEAISRITAPYVRAERVRQLIYAGLLAERGLVPQPQSAGRLASNEGPIQTEQPARSNKAQVATPVTLEAAPVNDPTFAADDLVAVFGP